MEGGKSGYRLFGLHRSGVKNGRGGGTPGLASNRLWGGDLQRDVGGEMGTPWSTQAMGPRDWGEYPLWNLKGLWVRQVWECSMKRANGA